MRVYDRNVGLSISVILGPHAVDRIQRGRTSPGPVLAPEQLVLQVNSCPLLNQGLLAQSTREFGTYQLWFKGLGSLLILKPIRSRVFKAVTYLSNFRAQQQIRGQDVRITYGLERGV